MKANKLSNLKLTSVSLVDAGANQRAHIMLKKRNDAPDNQQDNKAFFDQLTRFFAKMFGKADAEKSDARTFGEVKSQSDVDDTIYRITNALCDSLFSILRDTDLTDRQKRDMIATTAADVQAAIVTEIGGFFASELEKECKPDKACKAEEGDAPAADKPKPEDGEPNPPQEQEGESEMKDTEFDLTKMSPEDKAQFEIFKSKYGTTAAPTATTAPAADAATAATATVTAAATPAYDPEADPVVKSIREQNAALKADIEKMRDDMETEQLTIVAKKYEILGKKPEELVPVLKQMKAAGKPAYDAYVGALDEHVAIIEKSGLFAEVGKRGAVESNPWQQIEAHAAEIMKSAPALTREQAIDKAFAAHPELIAACEEN